LKNERVKKIWLKNSTLWNSYVSVFWLGLRILRKLLLILTLKLSSAPNVHFGAAFCAEQDAAKNFLKKLTLGGSRAPSLQIPF